MASGSNRSRISRSEPSARQLAAADSDIETFLDEIDDAVEQEHAHCDARKGAEVIRDDGEHVQPPERDRRGERKLALGVGLPAGEPPLGSFEFVDHAAAGFEVVTPRLRQRQAPRRPRDKPRIELILEQAQVPAHGRQRHAERAQRYRQAAGLGDGDEDAKGCKLVQKYSFETRNDELEI
jgi:hypothetical protein